MGKRIALVTGAAQGIGFACAEALVADGFRVVLSDVNAEGLAEATAKIGGDAVSMVCDMSDVAAIGALFDRIEAEIGPVGALVNNAGIGLPGSFLEYPLEDFQKVLDVNVTGVFAATQRAAQTMVEKAIKGAIVNMSSINAVVAIPAIPAYCASKGAVMQLTKASSLALAEHGIRVNAVGPGSIDTEMMAAVNSNPAAMQKALSRTPLGRMGEAKEIADAVAFLISDKASYITGETIYVDGGRLGQNYPV
ncbi:SDR family oxidoreductase [Alisedimentitalea sp. MJ-SS2]|uniref:SDR family NAD(P)-dependent oxidoreductase n=1 Tax=Aliisedimentitalea sp. MJ-SS2 TaxID=3049795 RepID=UPI0029077B79|nr:SDR family oxidoreductase [Alisedimentitalea sp. MJ-SS2]MDU8925828.1 SDR family oxidoreductase [Alisedimentitalea sp. MJ-SS2]